MPSTITPRDRGHPTTVDVLWGQLIKLIQVASTSEFHKY